MKTKKNKDFFFATMNKEKRATKSIKHLKIK